MLASTADSIVIAVVSLFVVIALVALWRVLIHDKSVARVRLGIFYEREREPEYEEEEPEEVLYESRDRESESRGSGVA